MQREKVTPEWPREKENVTEMVQEAYVLVSIKNVFPFLAGAQSYTRKPGPNRPS